MKIPALLLAAIALAGAVPATAQVEVEQVTTVVGHADLDLARPADRTRLERRVRAAIATVCPITGRGLQVQLAARQCRQLAAATTVPQIDHAVAAAAGGTPNRSRFAASEGTDKS